MGKPLSAEQRLEWGRRIGEQKESGLSIERWCRENQIPRHKFEYWKSRLFSQPLTRLSFSEIPPRKFSGVCFECRGLILRLDANFDPAVLKHCLVLLMEAGC